MKKPSSSAKRPTRKASKRASTSKRVGVTRSVRPADRMRDEYDFHDAVRGKYARAYRRGTNVVVLAPDVAAEFGSAAAVNRALRSLLKERGTPRRTA